MTTISSFLATTNTPLSSHPSTSTHASKVSHFSSLHRSLFSKSPSCPYPLCNFPRKPKTIVSLKSSEAEEISSTGDEWLQSLPDKKKPLYSHSLPCIEAWLKGLGFYQSKESRAIWFVEKPDWHAQLSLDVTDLYISLPCIEAWLKGLGFYQSKESRAIWFVEKPDWHAQLSLDVTDLYIRYLKNGPGNLEKDVERRFSYALSREDIENATLGGP